jgi:hypothetical protein
MTDIEAPTLENRRIDKDEPKLPIWSIDSVEPKRTLHLRESDAPTLM